MEIFCSQLYISCATTCAWPDVLLNLTSGAAGKTSFSPENSTKFLFWLPSYLKSHVIWRKLVKIIHHPGTEITTKSFQNFTPDSSSSVLFAIGISSDHLNLSPAPYLITCASPSLLAAASVASCFRFFPTSVAASPS